MQTQGLVFVALFACLTVVGAIIAIPLPFTLIPLTLQIPFTLSSGIVLGPKKGALSQLLYLFLGGIGLPVFAQFQSGFSMLFGPTAGFLWGFILSAYLTGWLYQRFRFQSLFQLYLILFAGLITIYCSGVIGMVLILKYSIIEAITVGVLPFIPIDLLKLLLTAIVVRRLIRTKVILTASR